MKASVEKDVEMPLLKNDYQEPLSDKSREDLRPGNMFQSRFGFKSTPPSSQGIVTAALQHKQEGRSELLTMTWYNTCLRSKRINNLHHINGFVEPGQLVAVLGDAHSGASELLKVLARHIKDVQAFSKKNQAYLMGEVLIDGVKFSSSNFRSKVKYVPKTDRHLAHLTVVETLEFAAFLQAPANVSEQKLKTEVQEVIDFLQIDGCKDTVVGDATLKGISGGQKRRVSIGVEIVAGYSILLGDLITNGLDSVTAHDIVHTCQKMALAGKSIVLTIAQPAARTFDLFTNCIMLHEGHQLFFGPVQHVKQYLLERGMVMPEGKTLPQWLEEICAEPELHWGKEKQVDDVTSYLVESYRESDYFKEMAHKLVAVKDRSIGQNISVGTQGKRIDQKAYLYGGVVIESSLRRGWMYQLRKIWYRQMVVQFRNVEILAARVYQALSVSVLLAIAFFGEHDPRSKISQFFFIVEFLAFSAVPFIPQLFNFRAVFYHQYQARYFNPFSYFMGVVCAEFPLTAVETMIFAIPVYFITSLKQTAPAFFYFYLVCLATRFLSWSLCNFMVFMFPTATVAQEIATLVLPIFIVFGGLYAPQPQLPNYAVWMWDISFAKFGFRGLVQNELLGDTGDTEVDIQLTIYNMGGSNKKLTDCIILWAWAIFWNIICYFTMCYVIWDSQGESSLKYWWKLLKGRQLSGKKKAKQFQHRSNAHVEFSAGAPVTIWFKDLGYLVANDTKTLLKGNWGYVKPGECVALMGPSGAGKTTIMNVLAAKTTGTVVGDVIVNGSERDSTYLQQIGYVEQFDSHLWVLTVRECVRFSADLRLDPAEYTSDQKDALVADVIDKVGLNHVADDVIGEGTHGLTQELRKITSIAVELVSRPGLLFLDEPTTGLDSKAALQVTQVVRVLAAKGLAVICTIHQPSPQVFNSFDKVLLLKARPGEIMYFESVPGLPDWYERNGYGKFAGGNIADFAIDAQKNVHENPRDIWDRSKEAEMIKDEIKELEAANYDDRKVVGKVKEYAVGIPLQFYYIFWRSWAMWSREHVEIVTRFIQSTIMGIVLGATYFGVKTATGAYCPDGNTSSCTQGDLQQNINQLGPLDIFQISLMFVCIEFATETGAQEIPHMVLERAILYRELEAKQYHAYIYYLARFAAQVPILFAQSVVFSFLVYPLSQWRNFSIANFALFFYTFFMALCAATTIAQLHAVFTPSEGVGNTLYTTFMTLSRAYCGYVNIPNSMNVVGKTFHAIDFMKYLFYQLANKLCGGNSGTGSDSGNTMYGFNVFEQQQYYAPNDEGFYIIYFLIIYFLAHVAAVILITKIQWTEK